MAGSKYNQTGSSQYLSLHDTPQLYLQVTPRIQNGNRASIYRTEYEARGNPPAFGNIRNHGAPCAVCYSSREYYGYSMT